MSVVFDFHPLFCNPKYAERITCCPPTTAGAAVWFGRDAAAAQGEKRAYVFRFACWIASEQRGKGRYSCIAAQVLVHTRVSVSIFCSFLTQHSHSPSAFCSDAFVPAFFHWTARPQATEISSHDLHVRSRCLVTQRPKRTPATWQGRDLQFRSHFAAWPILAAFSKSVMISPLKTRTLHDTCVAALERGRDQPIDATNGAVGN
jgi:hypothetical protein